MNAWWAIIATALGCYVAGAVPFGFLVGRARGIDIRTAGSGNIGATNVGRLLGRKWGILVFALDVAKGLVPTLLAGMVVDRCVAAGAWSLMVGNALWLACGVCCILGHNYPVFLKFKGGKGVATSLGVVLGVYPYMTLAGALAFAVWAVVTLTSRYVSLGSICAAAALPVLLAACTLSRGRAEFAAHLPLLAFAILLSGLVIYRHRGNLARLRAGTENRIGARPSAGGSGS
ncbi:MAG TPA: glycerol-3-phosphate 1-O-acyltransferase PlsY [Phycisphaerae bacterium]|nr:glycerol-3-phosphate 1-O-acyltransferase PlsY [Phycisphaerae bacterium]